MNKIICLLIWCLIGVHVEATLQCYHCSSLMSNPEYSEHCLTAPQNVSGSNSAPSVVTCSGTCFSTTISVKISFGQDIRAVLFRNCTDIIFPDGVCSNKPHAGTWSGKTVNSGITNCYCSTELCNGGLSEPQTTRKSTLAPVTSAAHQTTSSVAQYPLNYTKSTTSGAFLACESAAYMVLLGFTTILTANFLRG
ncbi:hypothetical protein BV898_02131 [Hypsibius exemplaris]|uniref:Protein sleepless n=1 Tax=Hypsibius exemplaris TaxID=2072580 RepID=A0A1W0X9W0_HYPEX|nr:hypothetical protein BV898_02131 [Hypsibius exemplaris]